MATSRDVESSGGHRSDKFLPLDGRTVTPSRAQPRPSWVLSMIVENPRFVCFALVASLVGVVVCLVAVAVGRDDPTSCTPVGPSSSPVGGLPGAMDIDEVMATLRDLEGIARAHNGSRSVTLGYNESAAYIMSRIRNEAPEYTVHQEFFTMGTVENVGAPILERVTPDAIKYSFGAQFSTMGNQGGGYANASLAVANNRGCHADDFPATVSGRVVLIKRGDCTFHDKVQFAQAAGAVGALIYNDGDAEDRFGVVSGTLGEPATSIPVFGIDFAMGDALAHMAPVVPVTMAMSSVTIKKESVTSNIIVDMDVGDPNSIVVVGSHLDSVDAGPGINDNGSGSATNLQLLLKFAQVYLRSPSTRAQVVSRVRFCFWGAEEEGLLGSEAYVHRLNSTDPAALARIAVNLNFDMLGSPNFIRGVLNGAGAPENIRPGSVALMNLFTSALASQDLTFEPVPFTGRSDYGPFLEAGIPAGGLDTGAEVIKTVEQRAKFGGLAQTAYDPCYHQACDTVDNINTPVLQEMGRAAATVLEQLATANVRALLS